MKHAELRIMPGYAAPHRAALTLSALLMLAESGMALALRLFGLWPAGLLP